MCSSVLLIYFDKKYIILVQHKVSKRITNVEVFRIRHEYLRLNGEFMSYIYYVHVLVLDSIYVIQASCLYLFTGLDPSVQLG